MFACFQKYQFWLEDGQLLLFSDSKSVSFLNQACTWFLKTVSVCKYLYARVCVCVCACVRVPSRLLFTSGLIWTLYDSLNKL